MLYRELIAVCSEIHTKHINTLCGHNAEFLSAKPCGVCINQWALKGKLILEHLHSSAKTPPFVLVLPLTIFHTFHVSRRTPATGCLVSLTCSTSHHASYSAWRTSILQGSAPVRQQRLALRLSFWRACKALWVWYCRVPRWVQSKQSIVGVILQSTTVSTE